MLGIQTKREKITVFVKNGVNYKRCQGVVEYVTESGFDVRFMYNGEFSLVFVPIGTEIPTIEGKKFLRVKSGSLITQEYQAIHPSNVRTYNCMELEKDTEGENTGSKVWSDYMSRRIASDMIRGMKDEPGQPKYIYIIIIAAIIAVVYLLNGIPEKIIRGMKESENFVPTSTTGITPLPPDYHGVTQ